MWISYTMTRGATRSVTQYTLILLIDAISVTLSDFYSGLVVSVLTILPVVSLCKLSIKGCVVLNYNSIGRSAASLTANQTDCSCQPQMARVAADYHIMTSNIAHIFWLWTRLWALFGRNEIVTVYFSELLITCLDKKIHFDYTVCIYLAYF